MSQNQRIRQSTRPSTSKYSTTRTQVRDKLESAIYKPKAVRLPEKEKALRKINIAKASPEVRHVVPAHVITTEQSEPKRRRRPKYINPTFGCPERMFYIQKSMTDSKVPDDIPSIYGCDFTNIHSANSTFQHSENEDELVDIIGDLTATCYGDSSTSVDVDQLYLSDSTEPLLESVFSDLFRSMDSIDSMLSADGLNFQYEDGGNECNLDQSSECTSVYSNVDMSMDMLSPISGGFGVVEHTATVQPETTPKVESKSIPEKVDTQPTKPNVVVSVNDMLFTFVNAWTIEYTKPIPEYKRGWSGDLNGDLNGDLDDTEEGKSIARRCSIDNILNHDGSQEADMSTVVPAILLERGPEQKEEDKQKEDKQKDGREDEEYLKECLKNFYQQQLEMEYDLSRIPIGIFDPQNILA